MGGAVQQASLDGRPGNDGEMVGARLAAMGGAFDRLQEMEERKM